MTFPTTVKAIGVNKFGDVDVIEKTDIPFPKHNPEDILVKVHNGGVNFSDTYIRAGTYVASASDFPVVLGSELSGTVVALPTDTTVLANADYQKRGYQIDGKVVGIRSKAFAEYVSIPWQSVMPVPEEVSLATAAAAAAQGVTAISFMTEGYDVKRGDTILVHTVAGGLGLFFAQYAKLRGATVIGTTSSQEKAEFAKKNGADYTILYKEEDTAARVLELTGGKGVDAVFDGVGKDTFETSLKSLKRKGTFVSVGMASGYVPPIEPRRLLEKNVKLMFPSVFNYIAEPEEGRAYHAELFDLIVKGKLTVNVHKHYPFSAEGAQQSQRDLLSGKSIGKGVIDFAE